MFYQQYVCRPSYLRLLASSVVVPMIDGWLVGGCYDSALLVTRENAYLLDGKLLT